jgi:hypothetical protein
MWFLHSLPWAIVLYLKNYVNRGQFIILSPAKTAVNFCQAKVDKDGPPMGAGGRRPGFNQVV